MAVRGLSLALILVGAGTIGVSNVLKWLMQGEVQGDHNRWSLMFDSMIPEEAYTPRGLKLRRWRLTLLAVGGASCVAGLALGQWLES
jgi:hypothetical protein